jgi:CubicO group peptidase (beta-lactamase class C family)
MKGRIVVSCVFSLLYLVFAVSQLDSQIDHRVGTGTPAQTDGLDDYINREMVLRKVPGLAFALLDHGHIVTERTYGLANVETGTPVDVDSVFELASVTKPITAVAVMMLVEERKIGLDDAISKYVADTPITWHGITVRELLSHTAGLREYGLVKCDGSE